MRWLSEAWKGVENGWKDLLDPGRKARGELEGLYSSERNKQEKFQNNLIDKAKGAASLNNSWAAKFLQKLQEAPDVSFNKGISSLNRGLKDAEASISKRMANRGISGSGIDMKALLNTQANKARGISSLQGQKVQDQVNNAGQSFDVIKSLGRDNYNLFNNAYGFNGGRNILDKYMGHLEQEANQGSPLGKLVEAAIPAIIGGMTGGPAGAVAGAASGISTSGVPKSSGRGSAAYGSDINQGWRDYLLELKGGY